MFATRFFFLTFLFFADFDVTDSVASMCNDWVALHEPGKKVFITST